MSEPLLEVKDLKVSFRTEDGIVRAVDGVSFSIAKGEVVGIVGESGSGKSVTMMSVMRLIIDPNAVFEGQVIYKGRDLMKVGQDAMREVRGAEIAMIFQDPMTSLNPVYRVGWQIAEQIREHEGSTKAQAQQPGGRAPRRRRDPQPEAAGQRLPASVLGRHAPAGDDRDGALVQPRPPDRRRADDCARRHDPGPDPRADRAAQGRLRLGGRSHHPRHGGRRRRRRPRHGHVRGQGRRARIEARPLLRPPAPVHMGAARLDPAPRPAEARAADGDPGHAALADQPARRGAASGRAARSGSIAASRCPRSRTACGTATSTPASSSRRRSAAGARRRSTPSSSRSPRERQRPGAAPRRGCAQVLPDQEGHRHPARDRPRPRRRRRVVRHPRGRDARARGRVRVRQVDARPLHRPPATS